MSNEAYTPSQHAAVYSRGGSYLVSAAAGSGKTRVLIGRLEDYILSGPDAPDIDRFVVITFTKAAAGELKNKISDALSKAAADEKYLNDSAMQKRIHREMSLIPKAEIGTIHHFCMSLIKEYSHETALPPNFRIISDETAASMKAEALDDVLNERYRRMKNYPGFEELVNSVGTGRDDSLLQETVLSLYNKMQSQPFPGKWAKDCLEMLSQEISDMGSTPWGEKILDSVMKTMEYWKKQLERVKGLCQGDARLAEKCPDNIQETIDGINEYLKALGKNGGPVFWDAVTEAPPIPFSRFPSPRNFEDRELLDSIKKCRDAAKKATSDAQKKIYAGTARLASELRVSYPVMKALVEVTLAFSDKYSQEKINSGYADFSDLEHIAAKLLLNEDNSLTPLAKEVSKKYREIMIDEYQDVSRVQDAIFYAISGGGKNLFMVGDVKQAIYRFRLADPEIFNEKERRFAPPGEPSDEGHTIFLSNNFRSRREIIDCANTVFSTCMSEALGAVRYEGGQKLVFSSSDYPDEADSAFIPGLFIVEQEDKSRYQAEAEFVAGEILKLRRQGYAFSDIAILLRAANSVGGYYRRELISRGIPVCSGQGASFFASREISFMLSLLRIIDNPHRDADLISVLSSPVFSFSADELADIRSAGKSSDYFDALMSAAGGNEKISEFLELLNRFRTVSCDIPADSLIRKIYSATNIEGLASAMPDGPQAQDNLSRLISVAAQFESDGFHGLHRFVSHLERLKETNQDVSVPSAAGAVQIVSIHHSKGLEYPVVFLCDLARKFNMQDSRDTVLVHPSLGLGPRFTDTERMVRYPTVAAVAIDGALKEETLSEEMRLLYVAMTRPKEKLYLVSASKKPDEDIAAIAGKLSFSGDKPDPEILSSMPGFFGWIAAAGIIDNWQSMKLQTVSREALTNEKLRKEKELSAEAKAPVDEALLSEIKRHIEYVYPYEAAVNLPSKITATELKKYTPAEENEEAGAYLAPTPKYFARPNFSKDELALSPTERGIATHLTLQFMDLKKGLSIASVKEEIARLSASGHLNSRQARAVRPELIVALMNSETGKRILNADILHREFKFSLLVKASELFETDADESILLQGVVDCCIEEPDGLVIIDYKTDNVRSRDQIEERAAVYQNQLKAYSLALERIFGKKVKQTVLYFLMAGAL